MKKSLPILILITIFAGNVFASDAMIVNSNPECGDLLSADTCDYSPPDLLLFQQLPTECDGEWA
ncbi:MAG: hypothetical protein GY855_10580, partial [candidate division Zixibacteria bacterium]|nr:hypothetical protein [candidate division Zixibacteria bacterium]